MLLSSYFILDFKEQDRVPEIKLPENACIGYRITGIVSREAGPFSKNLLLSYSRNRFCLLVDVDETEKDFENIIDSLVGCTFFYNYLKVGYNNPLVIFQTIKQEIGKYLAITKEIFKSHGYDDIETIMLNNTPEINLPGPPGTNICFNVKENSSDFFVEYANTFRKTFSADMSLFVFLDNPEQLPEILDGISRTEIEIFNERPQTWYLLKENRILKSNEQAMLFQLGVFQERINSMTNYNLYNSNEDSRYKRQITELLSFYKNEYEILPGWFKRLGHIVKVVMGKRTFKSLFNDNVKKYKE